MENREWWMVDGMENGEWRMVEENGEWRMENGWG
jgi:hypothetical protein